MLEVERVREPAAGLEVAVQEAMAALQRRLSDLLCVRPGLLVS
jgi:hypothetical protein